MNTTINTDTDELLTKLEIAKRLKVTTKTVEDWAKAGRIPRIKMQRAVRYSWPDVLQALSRFNSPTH